MNDLGLLVICVTAFFAVFVLLVCLAAVIRLLAHLFPEPTAGDDTALAAAIAGAVTAAYPGMRLIRIEEES